MKYQAGKETVLATGTTIVFPEAMDTADYSLVFRCYDPVTLETMGCTVDPALYTTTGFFVAPIEDAVIEYQATEYGTSIVLIAQTGRLSRDWTAQRFYAECSRDLGLLAAIAPYGERFNIVNRAVAKATSVHSALLGNSYKSSQSSSDTAATEVIISNIRMQMGGPEQRFSVESSVTDFVDMVSVAEYGTFRANAYQNTGRIIYAREGDTLLFKKSTALSNFGVRTYRYSRMPEEVTANEQKVDFPDSFMHLALVEGKRILAERFREIVGNVQYPEDTGEVATKKASETAQLEGGNTLKTAL